MKNYTINKQTELKANKITSKCMRFTLLLTAIIFLLNTFDFLLIDSNVAIFTFVISIFFLFIPTLLVDILNKDNAWIKYINIILSIITISFYYSLFTYNTILLFIFPLLLAGLFYDNKLTIFTIVMTIIFIILSHLLSYYLRITTGDPLATMKEIIISGLLPRITEYLILSYICYSSSSQTSTLVYKLLLSSEELQKRKDGLGRIVKGSAKLFTARNYTEIASSIMSEIINLYKSIYDSNNYRCCVCIRIDNNNMYRIDEKYKPSKVEVTSFYIYDKLSNSYEFNVFNNQSSIEFTDKNIIIKYYESNILLAYIILEDDFIPNSTVLIDLFDILYNNIGLGIKNALLTEEIFNTQEELILSLAEISECKSNETGMHIKRVYEYTRIMAKAIGLNKRDEDNFALASMMHDLGKLLIPSEILEKPGKLTTNEFEIIKTHVKLGADLLKNSPGEVMKIARNIALMHHEKWDGTGYLGMKGEEIDYYARIVAVIDVFDALVSNRCYKKSWAPEAAYKEIVSLSGKHFDPNVVELFKQNYKQILHILHKYPDDNSIQNNIFGT